MGRLKRLLPFLAGVVLTSALAWLLSGVLAGDRVEKALERERVTAMTTAETISANLGRNLEQLFLIPMILAKDPSVIAALRRFGPDATPSPLPKAKRRELWQADPEFIALVQRFEEIIKQADISQIWVVNAAADCFVSAGFPPELTSTGVNYVRRHYYQEGRQGLSGSQFAVGATTNIPGLYFFSPVTDGGRFLGVVTVKLELPKLAPLVDATDSLITDENGVIILSRRPDLLMKIIPGAAVYELPLDVLDNRYRRTSFETIDIRPAGQGDLADVAYWPGHSLPYIMKRKDLPGEVVSIYAMRPLDELAQIRRDRLWLFALFSVLGFLLVALALGARAYLRRNREVQEELTMLANTDALTRCANRRSFLSALDKQWVCAQRYGTMFSVISLDLDYFKSVNDRFGHAGGDHVLRNFVDTVGENLRSCDVLGRIGGEEFAILLPQTPGSGAAALAERILTEVRARPARFDCQEISYTCSCGVAAWRPGDAEYADILQRADQALYRAKSAGRNRVERTEAE